MNLEQFFGLYVAREDIFGPKSGTSFLGPIDRWALSLCSKTLHKMFGACGRLFITDLLKFGHFNLLNWVNSKYLTIFALCNDHNLCKIADKDNIDAQKEIIEKYNFKHLTWVIDSCAYHGNIHLLKWARESGFHWNYNAFDAAAEGNKLDTIKWLFENGCPYEGNRVSYYAAQGGHLETLKWVKDKITLLSPCVYDAAATGGHLEILNWALENDVPIDKKDISYSAAIGGNIEVVKWAFKNGGYKDDIVCNYIAENGHFELLKWARETGLPCNFNEIGKYAAQGGHLEMLKWAIENGCVLRGELIYHTLIHDYFDIATYLKNIGCNLDKELTLKFVYYNMFEGLKWLAKNGCPLDEKICNRCAFNGNLEMLIWAREHGCPWGEDVCRIAAEYGHFEMLKWAYENGCPCRDEDREILFKWARPE